VLCRDEHRACIVTAHPSNSPNILSRNIRQDDPSMMGRPACIDAAGSLFYAPVFSSYCGIKP